MHKKSYITVTLDTSKPYEVKNEQCLKAEENSDISSIKNGEYYKQTVYLNGEKLYEGDYNKNVWDYFVINDLPHLKCFCVGRSSMTVDGAWNYSKMSAYCLRLYSRALTEEEVNKNYEKSVEYHSLLESH